MLDRRSRGWRRTLAAIGIGAVGITAVRTTSIRRAAAVGIADIGSVVDVGNLGLRRLLFTARRISIIIVNEEILQDIAIAVILRFRFTSGIIIFHIILHSLLKFRRREKILIMIDRVGSKSDRQYQTGSRDAKTGFCTGGHMFLTASGKESQQDADSGTGNGKVEAGPGCLR